MLGAGVWVNILKFVKMQGLGNDFVIVNALKEDCIAQDDPQIARLAQAVCDRHFGVGGDGLVFIRPSKEADVYMQIINSDGSEAEMCGNVIRCVAKYLYEEEIFRKEKIYVETLAGIMVPRLVTVNDRVEAVEVDMGEPRLERPQIPMEGAGGSFINQPLHVGWEVFNITALSMGNPHCVIFVPDAGAVNLRELGPKIECHQAFPAKTNVEFVQVVDRGKVLMRVWERGAGLTMACGTGACAVAVAGVLNNLTQREVEVCLAAGSLLINWSEDNHVYMTGPAREVFNGEYFL